MRRHFPYLLPLAALLLAPAAAAFDPAQAGIRARMVPDQRLVDVPCVDGHADVFPCQGLDLLAFIPLSEFGIVDQNIGSMSETWGWADPETGDEYIIQGVTNGVHFVRVTDPLNPEYLGQMPNTAAQQRVWHDIKVNDNFMYSVSESRPHNVRAFDLTRLRAAAGPDNVFLDDGRYLPNISAHNLVINEASDHAYVVGGSIGVVDDECDGGLVALDLSNPVLPVKAGCWDGDAYVHDAQCVIYAGPDTEHLGKEICLGSNENTFSIVDFSDKANPVLLGRYEYVLVGYVHQGWISEDHRTFFLGDELDERDYQFNTRTLILDLEDLDNPRWIADYFHPTTSIDHNMYVKDGLLYQSNYTTGLRVYDTARAREGILDPVAWFDTFPDHDEAVFAGSWGNYPFLPSGTLAVSSGEEGLFLLRRKAEPPPAGRVASGGAPAAHSGSLPGGGGAALAALGLLLLAWLLGAVRASGRRRA